MRIVTVIPIAKGISKEYWTIKDREKPKYLPSKIVREMKILGYSRFGQHQHTALWKDQDAKNLAKGYGVQIEKTWYWYESWFEFVKQFCEKNKKDYV